MISPKMKHLIARLHELTKAQNVSWQETETDGIYQISFPTYSVSVSRRRSSSSQHADWDYWISIYNSDGKLIDEASDGDLHADFPNRIPSALDTMSELYDMARRSAMGVEDVIQEILTQLG